MCKYLEKTIKSWDSRKTLIGEDLSYYHKFFMIYREYCNNFMKGQQLLKKLKQH